MTYDLADNSKRSYEDAIDALRERLEKSKVDIGPNCTLYNEDCLFVLPTLSGVHSCVTDPPYHLTSIVKRFKGTDIDGEGTNETRARNRSDAMARLSRGFMGQEWDGGDVSFDPKTWKLVYSTLLPGAHLVSFAGTRTYHRIACAIDDAGFEIRDMLSWLYGSGFPKSHDVSKGIDRNAPRAGMLEEFAKHYCARRVACGLSHNAVCEVGKFYATHNHGGASVNWEKGSNVPTLEQWHVLQPLLGLSNEWLPLIQRVEAERLKIGERKSGDPASWYAQAQRGDGIVDITVPATEAAKQWEGWGTALKPACEPICFARKPLAGTVAQNVLEHGTGALNIDGCRVDAPEGLTSGGIPTGANNPCFMSKANDPRLVRSLGSDLGRWPANVLHDSSLEVLEAFAPEHRPAIRYFYSPKASSEERDGSTHPTMKPIDVMAWLCRLITPPNGTVLDPFLGSGTTGIAALRQGFRFIGIERSPEYFEIARRRIAAALEKPDLFIEPPKSKPIQTSIFEAMENA